jgi:hypothetical protein
MQRKKICIDLNNKKTAAYYDASSRGRDLLFIEIREDGRTARAWIDVSRYYNGKPPVLRVTVRKSNGQDKTTDHAMPWRKDNT